MHYFLKLSGTEMHLSAYIQMHLDDNLILINNQKIQAPLSSLALIKLK